MKVINFTKMVAAGNDFVVIGLSPACRTGRGYRVIGLKNLAREICDRKFGVGADGLLVLGKSRVADIKMRIFNADGSEAEMCGNGARCVGLYWSDVVPRLRSGQAGRRSQVNIETKAGIIESEIKRNNVKIKLTNPTDIKLDIPIKINNRTLRVNFINTGVPHTVIFVEGLDKIDVFNLGRQIRYHKKFAPAGTNVDFVEVLSNNSIEVRTYERGVEDETLACGTGTVAAALLYAIRYTWFDVAHHPSNHPESVEGLYANSTINVHTKSGGLLKVYFDRINDNFRNVWLEGKARIVYKGVYDV